MDKNDQKYLEICMILRKILVVSSYNHITLQLSNITSPFVLSFVNAHAINMALVNDEFRKSLLESTVILVDGVGMKILFKRLGVAYGVNMNGTDFIPYLLNSLEPQKIAIYGSTLDVLKNVQDKLSARHQVIDIHHGFEEYEFYLSRLNNHQPNIMLLGMGMPRQERLSVLVKDKVKEPVLIINGGAIVDFLGDKVSRAPTIVRKLNLEWCFRLLLEPKRLFKRYVIGNVLFLLRINKIKKYYV